jgi:hypothetical protein
MSIKKLEPRERITEPDHTITSKILGRDYQLYISFLKLFDKRHSFLSSLICFDGEWVFPIIRGTRAILEKKN